MRISLLLCGAAIASVYLFLGQRLGYLHAIVLLAGVVLLVWPFLRPFRNQLLAARLTTVAFGVALLWLGGYESRWFSEYCPNCGWERDCLDYRIMGIPVYADIKDTSLTASLALRDLGLGCRHLNTETTIYQRLWGGVLGSHSYLCNLRFDNRYMYTPTVSRRIKQSGESEPGLARKLQKRYLIDGDADYFWSNLLIDWVTLSAYDDGHATEARRWLTTPPSRYSEQILEEHPAITPEYVESLYADGVEEVIVIWWPVEELRNLLGDVVDSSIVVRLPSETDRRRQVFHKINSIRRADGERDLPDDGQQFAYAYEVVEPANL